MATVQSNHFRPTSLQTTPIHPGGGHQQVQTQTQPVSTPIENRAAPESDPSRRRRTTLNTRASQVTQTVKQGLEAFRAQTLQGQHATIAREYVSKDHMFAIGEAARIGGFAVSFRSAGAPTLDCLGHGAAAKGHDILEKTIKAGSVEKAYGQQQGPEILRQLKHAGVEGFVGHWDEQGLRGLYLRPDALEKSESLQNSEQVERHGDQLVYRVDVGDLNGSLASLKQALPDGQWKSLAFTGDYDSHDLINMSGHRAPIPSDSDAEKTAIDLMNTAVAAADQARPMNDRFNHVVQHGPQHNYIAHMRDKEKDGAVVRAVAEHSLPVAMCDRGKWSLINTPQDLEKFYKDRGMTLKNTWTDPANTLKDDANRPGSVKINRDTAS